MEKRRKSRFTIKDEIMKYLIIIPLLIFSLKANANNNFDRAWNIYANAKLTEHMTFSDFFVEYKKHVANAKKPVMAIINYSIPSDKKRLWIIDTLSMKLMLNTYASHGVNSGDKKITNDFSNKIDSKKSSLGVFLGSETYFGKHGYSLRLDGLDSTNDNARKRAIVVHGAAYAEEAHIIKNGFLGRSWGCPAVPKSKSKDVIDYLKNGSTIHSIA